MPGYLVDADVFTEVVKRRKAFVDLGGISERIKHDFFKLLYAGVFAVGKTDKTCGAMLYSLDKSAQTVVLHLETVRFVFHAPLILQSGIELLEFLISG